MESLTHIFSLKALIILLKKGRRMTVEEIAVAMDESHGGVVHAIDILEAGKLLESRVMREAPFKREVALTPVGHSVAKKVKEIEDLIGWMGKEGKE